MLQTSFRHLQQASQQFGFPIDIPNMPSMKLSPVIREKITFIATEALRILSTKVGLAVAGAFVLVGFIIYLSRRSGGSGEGDLSRREVNVEEGRGNPSPVSDSGYSEDGFHVVPGASNDSLPTADSLPALEKKGGGADHQNLHHVTKPKVPPGRRSPQKPHFDSSKQTTQSSKGVLEAPPVSGQPIRQDSVPALEHPHSNGVQLPITAPSRLVIDPEALRRASLDLKKTANTDQPLKPAVEATHASPGKIGAQAAEIANEMRKKRTGSTDEVNNKQTEELSLPVQLAMAGCFVNDLLSQESAKDKLEYLTTFTPNNGGESIQKTIKEMRDDECPESLEALIGEGGYFRGKLDSKGMAFALITNNLKRGSGDQTFILCSDSKVFVVGVLLLSEELKSKSPPPKKFYCFDPSQASRKMMKVSDNIGAFQTVKSNGTFQKLAVDEIQKIGLNRSLAQVPTDLSETDVHDLCAAIERDSDDEKSVSSQ